MNTLQAGFARVDVTPMLGISIVGYYKQRFAKGVLDPLQVNALALACGEEKVLLMCIDHCGIKQEIGLEYRQQISRVTGLPLDAIFLSATHTHTGPAIQNDSTHNASADNTLEMEYHQILYRKLADAAQMALDDLQPAKMGWGIGQAPGIAFVRRFRMKDGSVRTNPGVDNPQILAPLGDVDERVSVLRFDRAGDSLVFVHFANHPDVVGGDLLSGDWPALTRQTVEKALDGTKCILFNGAQGDVNHVNVHPTGGWMNGMFHDFDDVSRGYDHARYMGRVVAGGVLQAFDKVKYLEVDRLQFLHRPIRIAAQLPDPTELPEAHRIKDLHDAGRDHELPYEGMLLTTVVAEACRKVRLEHGPAYFDMVLSGIAIGDVALVGFPGEPFTGVGRAVKATDGWQLTLPCCLTNGSQGYFPMQDAYDEGGYEARSSRYKAGTAELIIKEGKALLDTLR